MKNWIHIGLLVIVWKLCSAFTVSTLVGPEGTNGTIINPYDVYDETLRIRHTSQGNATVDSILVKNDATDYIRRIGLSELKTAMGVGPSLTLTTTGTGVATYNPTTGVLNIPTPVAAVTPTINPTPGRTVNTNFTASTTRPVIGFYSITCSATNPLLAGSSTATAVLEYSTNGGTTWIPAAQNANSNSVALAVTIQLTNAQTGTVTGPIPANAIARIRTTTTGTASVSIVQQHEITF